MTEETLLPLDESDLIAHCGRQDQKIRELEAALAEKEEKIQAAMEAGKMLKEQRDKAEEHIAALTAELKSLTEAYNNTDWKKRTDEQKEIINNLTVRWGKVIRENAELTAENKRQSEEIRLLRRALGNCNPDHNLLMPEKPFGAGRQDDERTAE